MSFTDAIRAHRRSLLFLLAVLVVGGIISGTKLPVSLFPHVDFPRIEVSIDAGERPAETMAIEVTLPVEEAVRAVAGVRSLRSTTSRGSANISVNFDWGRDMVASMLQVESAVSRVLPTLPPGTTFDVRRMDPTVFPVLAYSLTSDRHSLVELRDMAFYRLRPILSAVSGVAKIGVLGGAREEYRVAVEPSRLASYGLSLPDVASALSAANVIHAVGRLEDRYILYLVVSDTRFRNPTEVLQTVLRAGSRGVVLLDDVATVSRERVPQWTRVTADGRDAVIVQAFQQPGGNTVQIARDLKDALARARNQLPKGVRIANWYDQSDLILASAGSVRDAVLIGVFLAALVLFAFLRNVKITFIAIVAVPSVLAAAVLLLGVMGMSFNIMTLGGMAAAVGLIVDDTIVMVEQIIRRLREGGGDHRARVMQAVNELTKPLQGSSASTIIIFAPLAFLSGVTGAFFKALSLTMAASLVISFFVAWLVVPMLAHRFLDARDAEPREGAAEQRVKTAYARWMRRLLRRPLLALLLPIPLLLCGWLGYRFTGTGFMPSMDEGGFILDYRAAPGTSVTETDRLLRQVETILRQTQEVETYSRRTGLQLGGGITEANEGDFFVRLSPLPRRSIAEVMDDVRRRIERSVPGLQIEMAQLMEDLIGDLTAVPQPIEVKLYSDDGALLRQLGPKVAAAIGKVPGVVDVKDGILLAGDALNVNVDRIKASLEGVDPEAVTRMVEDFASGRVTTHIQEGPKMVGLRVWIPAEARATERDLERLRLRAPDGHLFPLSRVASLDRITGEPQITRDDLKRMIAVTGRIAGRSMGSTVQDVKNVLGGAGLVPSGVYYRLGGLYAQQQIAFTGLLIVFVAAVLLVFLLLVFLYESYRVALAIIVTTLLAVPAVFIGLGLTGTELNISSMMGMTMIVGIVTEVAIFLCSEYFDLPAEIEEDEALVVAGSNRLRPIAMTTCAAILALAPLALGLGQGSAMQQPLAIAIISGLLAQLPLVVFVLPVLLFVSRVRRVGD